ncbi:uncharacterized protein LOC129616886 [Condylostylus longicornis]|uniref:uncharacterized protein LOC129616886 n=1 Tax=Condylostylus longicornis TaxID=2530218 RepID=UPI00244E027C|nr:uncharacterized protein LOC129616886 [Condylostylus longicornis]XP_055388365.1 uncharacterized protein LOC129616886 [Condylostylus longicornis]XP_055388366.1 uncharacterized protein LOC129616886 [Condylostylus longicornis]
MIRRITLFEGCLNLLEYAYSLSFNIKHLQDSFTILSNSGIMDFCIKSFCCQIKLFNQLNNERFQRDHQITKCKNNVGLYIFLSILVFLNNIVIVSCLCPQLCECKWKYGKESVMCVNANVSSIPNSIDSGTQILDLSGNLIIHIRNDIFANLELLNLQKLIISKCRLKFIERYAFRELNNLVELDLSYNRLSLIPSHTFNFIPELREIRLSGNPISKIINDAFSRIPKLTRIELSYCNISIIEPRAFEGIEHTLEWLKLDGNKLVQVIPGSFTRLQNLHGLELAQNLWNCSCILRPLRFWMMREKIPYSVPPTCDAPHRLFNKSWDKIDLDDFACVPVIVPNQITVYGVEGKNISLSCSVQDDGETNIRWTLKDRLIANLTYTNFNTLEIINNNSSSADFLTSINRGRKTFRISLVKSISRLFISIVEQRDAGIYKCVAENKAGWAEAHITLIVSRKFLYSSIWKNILVLCLFIVSVLMALLSLISLWKFSFRDKKKHIYLWNNISRSNSYEKIEMGQSSNNEICDNTSQKSICNHLGENKTSNSFKEINSKTTELEINLGDYIYQKKKQQSEVDNRTTVKKSFSIAVDIDNVSSFGKENVGGILCSSMNSYMPWSTLANRATPDSFKHDAKQIKINPPSSTCQTSEEYFSNLERICADSNSNAIFTLPRNSKSFSKSCLYSFSSQSYLLQDNHSQFDLTTSLEKLRRFSAESTCLRKTGNIRGKRSNSSLSLLKANSEIFKSTTALSLSSFNDLNLIYMQSKEGTSKKTRTPERETPLLDFSSYAPRNKNIICHASETSLNDFHTTQIERFLEEYRNLQEQLCKMKEACEEICQKESTWKNFQTSNCNFNEVMFDSTPSEKILRISNEKCGEPSLIFTTADPPPYWMHQNLKINKLNNAGFKIYKS